MLNTFAYAAVDAVQTSKKQFVTTFVKHEGISDTLLGFIDAQEKYTKDAIDAGLGVFASMSSILSDKSLYTNLFDNAVSKVKGKK